MTAQELKKKYLDFFIKKGHKKLPNVSLVSVPEFGGSSDDLFINSGMHPLVPYLLGKTHHLGKRLVSNQRCLRTEDIKKIGNAMHLTFFEMLGNWSLGDYWKEEAIKWSWEFLTKVLNLEPKRISVTCFAGDKNTPRDEEAAGIWQKIGIPEERIYFLGKEDNWWKVGDSGPCGPDTEMFYDTGKKKCGPQCRPDDNCGKYFEVWNDVFMEFNRLPSGRLEKLKQRNIDTGMGVERITAMLQGKDDVYQTELFEPIIQTIEKISKKKYQGENEKPMRIIADHLRAATFAIGDGVIPYGKGRGNIIHLLIKDARFEGKKLGIEDEFTVEIVKTVINNYQEEYEYLKDKKKKIEKEYKEKVEKLIEKDKDLEKPSERKKIENPAKRLKKGDKPAEVFKAEVLPKLKGLIKNKKDYDSFLPYVSSPSGVAGTIVFTQKSVFGRPIEGTTNILKKYIRPFDENKSNASFQELQKKHQEVSKISAEKKFAGGLVDHSETVTKYHTVTHLLHQALRDVLGKHVQQVGSNITPERLRFDFSHPEKLTDEQIKKVEAIINAKIKANLPVKAETISLEEAKKKEALAFFGEKYGDQVKVYSIGNYSQEVCGGPHVKSTREIGRVKIIKEKAVGAGRRRIYIQLAHGS
ncbi:MAG TPA: alanine--tRNA ligase-related protein [Patescibacteria group bacterium]|nr:alanine--tRNA ligase-related protein [Patescibacteria group bacterium]